MNRYLLLALGLTVGVAITAGIKAPAVANDETPARMEIVPLALAPREGQPYRPSLLELAEDPELIYAFDTGG